MVNQDFNRTFAYLNQSNVLQMLHNDNIDKLSLHGECWKEVFGYEGIYIVSSLGRVMNIQKAERRVQYKILRPLLSKTHYLTVCLYKDKKCKRAYIHRLVAEAFIDNPLGLKFVDHKNTCRHDNCVSNLRWVSNIQNLQNPITRQHLSQSAKGDYSYEYEYILEAKKTPKRKPYSYIPIVSTEDFLKTNSHPGEEWKPISGFEHEYMISNLGRVLSLPKTIIHRGRESFTRHKFLNPSIGGDGYYRVCLNGKFYRLHRVIATAFIPNPEGKPCIDHINAIRTDNRIENLRWVTHKENMNNPINRDFQKANSLGRKQSSATIEKRISKLRGKKRTKEQRVALRQSLIEKKGRSVSQYDLNHKLIATYPSISTAHEHTGITASLIHACCNNRQKTSGGFIWEYASIESNT